MRKPPFDVGEKVFAVPFDEYLGYYRGDDDGNPIPVTILEPMLMTNGFMYLFKVMEPDGFANVYSEKELFRTEEEIPQIGE